MVEYRDFLTFVFSAAGESLKEKTRKIFSHEQQRRLWKNLEISKDALVNELAYGKWLGLFDFYSKMVPPYKKYVVAGAYKRLFSRQTKLEKLHRNRKK